MTVIARNNNEIWLPKFEPWRLLRPLKMNWPSGQFKPFQRIQFEEDLSWVGENRFLTYVTSGESVSSNTTFTFNSVPMGADAGARVNVICFGGTINTGNRQVSSATILGSAGTLGVRTASAALAACGIYYGTTTGLGATGTIAVTFSANCSYCGYAVYRCDTLTVGASTTDITPASGVLDLDINVASDEEALACSVGRTSGAAQSWGGSPSEDYNFVGGTTYWAGASGGVPATPMDINVTSADTTPIAMTACSIALGP